jgi:uncharacterized cupredoxin-like copper-binding protein
MTNGHKFSGAVLATLFAGFMGGTALAADTVVKVSMWDNGADKEMVTNMAMGGDGDHAMANMGFKLSQDTVKAGEITFEVTNDSKETVHEMLIMPLADGMLPPINAELNEIDEDKAGALGEVAETEPGKTGAVSFNLKPGKYLLACNIAGHYTSGMWAVFTVE